MPRPKKKRIEFNITALTELSQEIYNESVELRSKALFSYNKQNKNVNDNQDIAMVGKINSELLRIVNDTIEKKITVAKILKDVIFIDKNNTGKGSDVKLSEADKKEFYDAVKSYEKKNNVKIDFKGETDKKDE